MLGRTIDVEAVKALAVSSFYPRSREQAVAQCLAVALERRRYNRTSITPFGLGWLAGKLAIKKARLVRDAKDWRTEFNAERWT